MSDIRSEAELRRIAERRADAKLGFRAHLVVFILVNAGLTGLNLLSSPHVLWFQWPLFGWGIGLVAHGVSAYGLQTHDREKMVQTELERLKRRG
jgi:uncharacterized membrane protein